MSQTQVQSRFITDNSVTTAKIIDNAIETAKIKDKNVTKAKLADDVGLVMTSPYPFTTRGFSMPI
jgi:hypothetical protein